MNFTLFGYPKTGKTTLFNILTGAKIEVQKYESGKKEPNLRTCKVPDPRLDKLCSLYPDKEKKNMAIDYIDLAGISYGELKSDSYLNYLRKADGLTHVVRGFQAPQIPFTKGKVDIPRDIKDMEAELILADLASVESRIEKLEKELGRSKIPEGEKELELLKQLLPDLEEGRPLRELTFSPGEDKRLRNFAFLSRKPILHMINLDEQNIPSIENPEELFSPKRKRMSVHAFCGLVEMEILELEDSEREIFLQEYGLKNLSSPKFLSVSRDLLDAITFFTIGKEEVKAWTIKRDSQAVNAAGAIHTDIERGFIRAEVIQWDLLHSHGSFQNAKENAAVRLEGKEYIVQDGDVIYFRFAK